LLKGERDPIENYGVSLKALDVDAQKLEDAKNGLVFASEKEADINATLTLLYQKTTDAQGQAARESESYAGVTGALTAKFTDMQAEIGQALLPVLSDFSAWLQTPEGEAKLQAIVDGIVEIIENLIELVIWVDDNQDWLVPMVTAIGAVTTAWNAATTAVTLFKAAAGISSVAAVTGGVVGAGLVGGAAVGAYYSTEAQQTLQQKMDAAKAAGEPNWADIQWWPEARTSQPTITNNINVKTGATAQEIADAINRANRASGTNLIRPR
jgi:hypothetical protein